MFERFTQGARQVVVLAQEEARILRHNYIGTEHLLLGVMRNGDATADLLAAQGAPVERARARVIELAGAGNASPTGQIPFTDPAKRVLELSLREALELSSRHIGTEHLLLGLMTESDGAAGRVLTDLGVEQRTLREQLVEQLDEQRASGGEGFPGEETWSGESIASGQDFRGTELRRVLLPDEWPRSGLRINTVELYDDGVIVRSQLIGHVGRSELFEFGIELHDDLDTPYRLESNGFRGSQTWFWESRFVPAAPAEAGELRVQAQLRTNGAADVRFPL